MSQQLSCSFCGASDKEAEVLIRADKRIVEVLICDKCIDLCANILAEARAAKRAQCRVMKPVGQEVCEKGVTDAA